MPRSKSTRDKGKISFTKYFQNFAEGDSVAVVQELAVVFGFSKRLQGRTGKIIKKVGTAYEVEIMDFNKPKRYKIRPIHLKRITDAK